MTIWSATSAQVPPGTNRILQSSSRNSYAACSLTAAQTLSRQAENRHGELGSSQGSAPPLDEVASSNRKPSAGFLCASSLQHPCSRPFARPCLWPQSEPCGLDVSPLRRQGNPCRGGSQHCPRRSRLRPHH